jgi:hypothetical protein
MFLQSRASHCGLRNVRFPGLRKALLGRLDSKDLDRVGAPGRVQSDAIRDPFAAAQSGWEQFC